MDLNEILQLKNDYYSIAQVGAMFKHDRQSMYNIIKRIGIVVKKKSVSHYSNFNNNFEKGYLNKKRVHSAKVDGVAKEQIIKIYNYLRIKNLIN